MIKGMMRKKRNPFGMQGDIPDDIMHPGGGIGGGAYGVGSGSPEAINEAPKPGFFSQGGVGRGIAGTLGDFLLQQSGNQPIYQPAMRQQGAIRAQQQQAEAKRFADNQDWMGREAFKRSNPTPNDFTKNLISAGIDPASADGQKLYRERVQNQADPLQRVDNGNGTFSFVRPSQMRQGGLPGGQGVPSAGTVKGGYRFKGGNPNDKNNWEKVGGQASASGNFQG